MDSILRYRNAGHVGIAIGIAILAAIPRLWDLFRHPTIPDEAFTYWLAAHQIPEIFRLLRSNDFHPPLVYLVAHALLTITPKAFTFRLLAAGAGIVGVLSTYFIALRINGKWAWLAAALVALCPILMYFDRFYRMYAFLSAFAALSWLLLLRATESPDRAWRWIAYSAVVAAMLYTHYLAFFVLGAQMLFVLVKHRRAWPFYVAAGIALVAWLPWLPVFLAQFPNGGTAFNQQANTWNVRFTIPAYMLTDGLPAVLEYNSVYLAIMWAVLLAGFALAAVRPAQRLALWLALPAGLQILFSVAFGKNLLGQRYLLHDVFAFAIGCTIVVQTLLETKLRALGLALGASLVLLMGLGTYDKLFVSAFGAVDWNVYTQFLAQRLAPGDVVVFDDVAPWFALVRSPIVDHRTIFLISNQKMAAASAPKIISHRRVWYIDYQSNFSDPNHIVFKALLKTHPITTTWESTESGRQDHVVTTLFAKR